MKMKAGFSKAVLTIMFAVVLISGSGCSMNDSSSLAAPVEELDQRLVDANNIFGFELFRELAEEEDGNLFISPSSIITALAMTYNGAEGETKTAVEETLNFHGMSLEEVNAAFRDLLTVLQNPDPRVELTVANSLWAREGFDFYEEFLETNSNYYNAEISFLDFSEDQAADEINSWVKEQTSGKIEQLVTPPINPETILFLINAIYFYGEWSEPFDPEMTNDNDFHQHDGTVNPVPTMFKTDNFRYLENELFQAVSLPYGENERVSIYLFLPLPGNSLEQFYAELNQAHWDKWIASFGNMEGEVGLPKFSFDYEVSLNDALKLLGMEIAFDGNRADFSSMHPVPPDLYISEVKHKSFIEVNEEGTEAAAATSVEDVVTALPETFSMIIDRPFFFAIADDMTGTILFMGSVVQP